MMGEYCNGLGGYWRETMLERSSALLVVVAVEMALFLWLLFVLNFFLRNVDDLRKRLAADEMSSPSSSSSSSWCCCGCNCGCREEASLEGEGNVADDDEMGDEAVSTWVESWLFNLVLSNS